MLCWQSVQHLINLRRKSFTCKNILQRTIIPISPKSMIKSLPNYRKHKNTLTLTSARKPAPSCTLLAAPPCSKGSKYYFCPVHQCRHKQDGFLLSLVLARLNLDWNAFAHERSIKSLEHKLVSASACVGPTCCVCRHYPCLNSRLPAFSEDATAVTTCRQVLAAVTFHLPGQQNAWKAVCPVLVEVCKTIKAS